QVSSIDTTGSFITSWVDQSFDNTLGTLSAIGGVPNPGFKTSGSDATLETVTFNVLPSASGTTAISFDTTSQNPSAIYRNSDNQNILDTSSLASDTLSINPAPSPTPNPTSTP